MARYGWVKDKKDTRDIPFTYAVTLTPPRVDLRPHMPPVYDQGQLGSCTANAIGAAIEYDRIKQGLETWVPSRLFIYYNERGMEGTIDQDAGAQIRDGIKSVVTLGEAREELWPYDVSKFAVRPPDTVYAQALAHKTLQYRAVQQTLPALRAALAAGFPVVFGFTVYESFESATVAASGVMPMPHFGEQVLGGHAVLAVGYDDATKRLIVRNSWGTGWGQQGYFTMPYGYVTDASRASDFWVMPQVA